ncbi:hypothetical protein Syun_003865 [Stephania yunnanensis]|uniref:Uncharacterized protein n=1 Tax=Stephania yunnanensis TaxID=152371 RepID=A0AAP0L3D5_9MAGN
MTTSPVAPPVTTSLIALIEASIPGGSPLYILSSNSNDVDDLEGSSSKSNDKVAMKEGKHKGIWGSFNGEVSHPSASRAAFRDDYTMIFYPPASVAVGGGFRPSTFPTMELEYVGAAQVHEFARRNLPRSSMLNANGSTRFSLGSCIRGSWEPPVSTRK